MMKPIDQRALTARGISLWVLAGASLQTGAAAVDPSLLPPPAPRPVDYERDVRPILQSACLRCHGPEQPKGGFRLDNRESALKGGAGGVAIVPGRSAESRLVHFTANLVADMEMPPKGRGEPLTAEQVGILRAWIDQGANYPADAASALAPVVMLISPTVRWVTVSGNEAKFREHWWIPDGFSGGVERFEWQEPLGPGRKFTAEGRLIAEAGDYRLKLTFEDQDLGFIRAGFEQSRKWSDDTGGYYAPFDQPPLRLDRDLTLDLGRAWFEIGLNRPHWPQVTVGYEYLYRDGDKSTLQWGAVTDPATFDTRAIYPSAKGIDEDVHAVRLDFRHTVAGFEIEDSFRGEFVDATTRRRNVVDYTYGEAVPGLSRDLEESYDYFQGANALRIEKPIRDWLFLSAGYLYSNLDGDAGFSTTLFDPRDPTLAPFEVFTSPEIVMQRTAHVFNANAQVQAWRPLSLTAGVQADWSRQEGFGNAVFNDLPTSFSANLDRVAVDELLGLRFKAIPYTVVHADLRLQQESVGQYEQGMGTTDTPPASDFLRDTDAQGTLLDCRAGLSVSPWSCVSLDLGYRHRDRTTDFDTLQDTDLSAYPGNGYPAFIRARDELTDQGEVRLVLQPVSWLKATFGFQPVGTEFRTTTADWVASDDSVQPGGRLTSGNYDAQNYSVSATVTRWRRLYFTTTFVYADSRIDNGFDTEGLVSSYAGDQFSVLSSATYALGPRDDLTGTYSFSRADFEQSSDATAFPLGIVYDRHALTLRLNHRFRRNWTGSLEYGCFLYDEPSAAGALDYTAHAIFATLTKRFR